MQPFLEFLLRSTLLLFIGGCVVGLLFRFFRCHSPAWNRFAWAFVLLLGIACIRLPLEIPALTPQPVSQVISSPQTPALATPETFEASPPVSVVLQHAWTEFLRTHTVSFLFAVWLGGAVIIFALELFFWFVEVRQVKDAVIPAEIFQAEWKRLLVSYGISNRNIELRIADGIGPELVLLPTKSIIVVPAALWEEAPEHVRLGILKHEISHYLHCDLLKSLALWAIALLHWFNPMAHYAIKRFDEAAEWRCDADAFGSAANTESDFAETMLLFRDIVPVAAVRHTRFCGNNIRLRSERLINFKQNKGDSFMKKMLIVLCCAALSLAGLFEIKLTAKTTENEPDIPIVEIEARVVSASREFARDIVVQFGFENKNNNIFDTFLLDAAIASGESKGSARLISQPKLIVHDNNIASITSRVRFFVEGNSDNADKVDDKLTLTTKPQITDDGGILLLDIIIHYEIAKDGLPTARRSEIASTPIPVKDGGTIVLEGIIFLDTVTGIDRKILFFITPRIIR